MVDSPPVLPFDWDPGSAAGQEYLNLRTPEAATECRLGTDFFLLHSNTIGPEVQQIIEDLVQCVKVALYVDEEDISAAGIEHWLFMRHQALMSRLLSLPKRGAICECCRYATLLWILSITNGLGSQADTHALRTAQHLKKALSALPSSADVPQHLLFWIAVTGAMAAEGTNLQAWFDQRVLELSQRLEVPADEMEYYNRLSGYLYVESAQRCKLRRLVARLQ